MTHKQSEDILYNIFGRLAFSLFHCIDSEFSTYVIFILKKLHIYVSVYRCLKSVPIYIYARFAMAIEFFLLCFKTSSFHTHIKTSLSRNILSKFVLKRSVLRLNQSVGFAEYLNSAPCEVALQ